MKSTLVLFFVTQIVLSQTDKMYIGNNEASTEKKLKTIEKASIFSDDYIVYGKYSGVNWKTGEIDFLGNDGKLYSDPTYVQSIKNGKNENYVASDVLKGLKGKKREIAVANLKAQCEKNSKLKVMIIPFKNDFYGLTEDVEATMSNEGCYNVLSNEKGLEYIFNSDLSFEKLNDYTLRNIGEEVGVDYIIYGYSSEYDVPFKYAAANSNQSIDITMSYDSNDWLDVLLISLNNWAIAGSEMNLRSSASLAAGSYISLTYFSININNGQKKFLTRNKTVLKKG